MTETMSCVLEGLMTARGEVTWRLPKSVAAEVVVATVVSIVPVRFIDWRIGCCGGCCGWGSIESFVLVVLSSWRKCCSKYAIMFVSSVRFGSVLNLLFFFCYK